MCDKLYPPPPRGEAANADTSESERFTPPQLPEDHWTQRRHGSH